MDDIERIASEIVDAAVKLHIRVGPGLLESVYDNLRLMDLRLGFLINFKEEKLKDGLKRLVNFRCG